MAAVSETALESHLGNLSKPLHIQRIEKAVNLEPFLSFVGNLFDAPISDKEDGSDDETDPLDSDAEYKDAKTLINGLLTTKHERKSDKMMLYNFSKVKKSRKWLKNILLSDSSDSSEDDIDDSIGDSRLHEMLKLHSLVKTYRANFHADRELQQYQYYSVGLLSNQDKFYEHQKLVVGNKKKNKEKKMEKKIKAKLKKIRMKERRMHQAMKLEDPDNPNDDHQSLDSQDGGQLDDSLGETFIPKPRRKPAVVNEMTLAIKRRKLWVSLSKKEISKAQKQKVSAHKEVLTNCKKMAQACQKEVRKAAIQSQKLLKETPSRAKRLTREMLLYWKRYEKVEKEHRKKAEKEAQEQLKMDIELREAKRQQRKLNFLITQTELYAHFMSRKMGISIENLQDRILGQLDEEDGKRPVPDSGMLLDIEGDDYDSDFMKTQALRNVQDAYNTHQSKTNAFDHEICRSVKVEDFKLTDPSISTDQDRPQPRVFEGQLKTYQLKGMNWLANLYDQGLNGILADEMGLGKTVQSIAFLGHIAESQGIWGPFLIIAPASTLHNWQQEFARFVPNFKVVPYWGNTNDRKILRKFWNQKDLHTEDASFHVLVTSYQLVVQDVKYFQRIKWQYMVLDEAQAIKSSSSVRWKILLSFSCRNRLLLTGTPIQNSMAELWALLHFIMPTLFDSHDEFSEWFSKDIESHAENKSTIDEKHLSRLHLILKPFMLRRIKKDVENELSDKIEVLVYCHLTTRQKHLYEGLKQKISIDDLLHSSAATASSQAQTAASSLMNLVMQFRKVCNHPELFERREVRSPLWCRLDAFILPKLIYRNGILSSSFPSKQKIFLNMFNIFHPEHIHHSLFSHSDGSSSDCTFSFSRFINLSANELRTIFMSDSLSRWLFVTQLMASALLIHHIFHWRFSSRSHGIGNKGLLLWPLFSTSFPVVKSSLAHREMRAKKFFAAKSALMSPKPIPQGTPFPKGSPSKQVPTTKVIKLQSPPHQLDSFPFHHFVERAAKVMPCERTNMPAFLSYVCPKIGTTWVECYSSDRSAVVEQVVLKHCGSRQNFEIAKFGSVEDTYQQRCHWNSFSVTCRGGLSTSRPLHGWSQIIIPDKETLVTDSGKLHVLDKLLTRLKSQGHRVLIYSQMTRMIDLLEEYMWHRKHTYMRLDGSSKISDRRDMVADFQTRSDIFVFLLSTRAGGLGINLTAADTVVFYDSDWNPTVDQQAMDRAHRLGQTKQVTVYRLVCKGTIEERILQRAREKSEIQRMVISGGNFKPDTLKPKEVVSLLLDDDELELKFRQRQEERKQVDDQYKDKDRKRKRDKYSEKTKEVSTKRRKQEENITIPGSASTPSAQDAESVISVDSIPASPSPSERSCSSIAVAQDETSNEGSLVVDDGSPSMTPTHTTPTSSTTGALISGQVNSAKGKVGRGSGRGRGRPKGSGKRGGRGRGATLAAAEMAGAQAGLSAAYAAYGYALQGSGSPALRGNTLGRGHRPMMRGGSHGAGPRGSGSKHHPRQRMTTYRSKAKSSSAKSSQGNNPGALPQASSASNTPSVNSNAPAMGFYTQGPDA